MKIIDLTSRKILNSKGLYTIETSVKTENGVFSASVPRGTSKGRHEVCEFSGGIEASIKNINKKIKLLAKKEKLNSLNGILDFEKKTEKYGGSVVLSVTYVLLKALAAEKKVPVWKIFTNKKKLPKILAKVIGGGVHAGSLSPTFQEFLVLGDVKAVDKLLKIHKEIGTSWGFGGKDMEGGWAVNVSNEKALEITKKTAGSAMIGLDIAATEFYSEGKYNYRNVNPVFESGKLVMPKSVMDSTEQLSSIKKLQEKYDLYYIEDPFYEDDFRNFAELTKILGKKALVCGDDLFATNPERLKKGITIGACNSCIVKPDQIGSLKKTIEFVELAKKNNYVPVISHRSGETNDDIIADLAVGLQIPIIKIGICGGERVSKINRLLKIMGE